MTRKLCALSLPLIAFGLQTLHADDNLAVNPSFEKPVATGLTCPNNVSKCKQVFLGQDFGGWGLLARSVDANIFLVNGPDSTPPFNSPAAIGSQWVNLAGYGNVTPAGVEQSFPTIPGATYVVTFFVGNIVDPSGYYGVSTKVQLLVNGQIRYVATNSQGAGLSTIVWRKFQFEFTATNPASGRTVISFQNTDPVSDHCAGLDGIAFNLKPSQ